MKKLLISTAFISLITGAASAQMVFEQGDVSLSYYNFPDSPGLASFVLDASGAYQIGQIGVQLDAAATVLTDFTDSFEMYSVGGRAYYTLANGTKLGGYLGVDSPSFIPVDFYSYGVEAMVPIGILDVEAFIGAFSVSGGGDPLGNAGIQAYYGFSQAFEVSAGANFLWESGFSSSYFNVGAEYSFSNIPISLGATYIFGDDVGASGIIGVTASFSFGPNQDSRLFGNRVFPIFAGIL